MKKIYSIILILLLSLSIAAQTGEKFAEESVAVDTFKVIKPNKFHAKVDQIVTTLLTRYHYKKIDLNDSLSSIIFDSYFEALDYNKVYFLKSDLEKYENYRYLLDDMLLQGNLTIPYDIFNTYKLRMNTRVNYIIKRLETEFDYSIDEEIRPKRKELDWAESEEELDDVWRKRLRNDALNKNIKKEEESSQKKRQTK